jgi:hypothetical protein
MSDVLANRNTDSSGRTESSRTESFALQTTPDSGCSDSERRGVTMESPLIAAFVPPPSPTVKDVFLKLTGEME